MATLFGSAPASNWIRVLRRAGYKNSKIHPEAKNKRGKKQKTPVVPVQGCKTYLACLVWRFTKSRRSCQEQPATNELPGGRSLGSKPHHQRGVLRQRCDMTLCYLKTRY